MKFPVSVRREVETRAGKLCEYCLCPLEFSTTPYSVEHIFPVAQGGNSDLANLALSCQGCNGYKSSKTVALDAISHTLARFYHPRQDVWQEHFTWSEDFMEIVGLTAKGRVTVKALKLNRARVINLRRILAAGWRTSARIRLLSGCNASNNRTA